MSGAEEVRKHFEKGKTLRERNYYKAASLEFEKAAEVEPLSADILIEWGQALFENYDYADAIEKYQNAIVLDSTRIDAYKRCGEALTNLGRYREAAEQYQRATELDPQDIDSLSSLAYAWSALGDWKLTIGAYLKVIDGHPDQDVWSQLTNALDELESNDRAKIVDELNEKLSSDVRYASALVRWGKVLAIQHRYPEAITHYQEALRLDPKHMDAIVGLGDALKAQEKYDEAIDQYRKAAQVDPSQKYVYARWSRVLLQQGRYVESLTTFLKSPDALDDSYTPYQILDDTLLGLDDDENLDEEDSEKLFRDSGILAEIGDAIGALSKEQSVIATNSIAEALRTAHSAPLYCSWGRYLASRKRYPEAIGHYQEALKFDPKYVNAILRWGDLWAAQNRYDEAIEQYRKAIVIDATSASAYRQLASALSSKGQHNEAAEQYQQVMQIDLTQLEYSDLLHLLDKVSPDKVTETLGAIEEALNNHGDIEQHIELGDAFSEKKWHEKALVQYEKALQLNKKNPDVWSKLGNTHERLRDYSGAIESYKQVTLLDPYEISAYKTLGTALNNQDRYAEAIEQYKKILELDPDNATAYSLWGWAHYQQEDYEGANAQYKKACEVKPQDAHIHHDWGVVLVGQRRFEEAIEQFQQALTHAPDIVGPYLGWGNALDELGRRAEAIGIWEEATRLDPNYAYAYHNIANCLWAQGDYQAGQIAWETACVVYERAKEKAKEDSNADLFNYYGYVVRECFGQLEKAEQIFQNGLAIDPEHPEILANLMSLYLEHSNVPPIEKPVNHGRYQAQKPSAYWMARESFRKAERILKTKLKTNESAYNLQQLGALFLDMQEYDEAKVYYEKALKKDPESWAINVGLGVICSRKEDFRQAVQFFESAHRRNRNDLNAWGNMAEVYLKLDPTKLRQIEKAEAEYRNILKIAPQHIDALIGLGEVYLAMATISEKDLYETAIQYYGDAIDLINAGKGSKRMEVKDRAALHYSRGYARVQYYEATKPLGDEKLLAGALEDFERCCRLDRTHHKADRARIKLENRLSRSSSQRILESVAPWMVMVPAFLILAVTQTSYYLGVPTSVKDLEPSSYITLTFGTLLFFVIGLFLPQIQKLKGAGIELEKVTGSQISTSGSIGVSKP